MVNDIPRRGDQVPAGTVWVRGNAIKYVDEEGRIREIVGDLVYARTTLERWSGWLLWLAVFVAVAVGGYAAVALLLQAF
jgi:hypothetical protein